MWTVHEQRGNHIHSEQTQSVAILVQAACMLFSRIWCVAMTREFSTWLKTFFWMNWNSAVAEQG